MVKYCTKCGKKVEDCICNKNEKIIKTTNNDINLKQMILKPFDNLKKQINDTTINSYLFMLLSAVCTALIMAYGSYLAGLKFVYYTLASFVLYLLLGLIIKLLINAFTKEEIEYKKIANVVGFSALFVSLYELLFIFTLLLFNCKISLILVPIAFLHFSILICYGIGLISKIDINKIPYLYILTLLIMIIVKAMFIF